MDDLNGKTRRRSAYRQEEFAHVDSLASDAAATLIGQSSQGIDAKHKNKHYYALENDDLPDTLRYPKWQFAVDNGRLRTVLEQISHFETNCWVIHHFLQTPHFQLDGRRPCDVIGDHSAVLDSLSLLVRERFGTGLSGKARQTSAQNASSE